MDLNINSEETLCNILLNSNSFEILDKVDLETTEVKFERLNGLSNAIFLVILINKESGEEKNRFILRNFGQSSEFSDRDLEEIIIRNLAEKGFGPKIYDTDNFSYRIEEYIHNSKNLGKNKLFEKDILKNLIQILISYTLISNLYYFFYIEEGPQRKIRIEKVQREFEDLKKKTEKKFENQVIEENVNSKQFNELNTKFQVLQNIYDLCLEKMLPTAQKNIEKISLEIEKNNKEKEKPNFKAFEKISKKLTKYKNLFLSIFPQRGLFVLNHNDVNRLNILETQDKIMLIDHEYSALNLIGSDIVNYCIENCFDYTLKKFPFYEFKKEKLNFDFMFKIYLKFLKEFESSYHNKLKNLRVEIKGLFEETKTFKYFLTLVSTISLFWYLYSINYMNIDTLYEMKSFDYFSHAEDRIFIFKCALNQLRNL